MKQAAFYLYFTLVSFVISFAFVFNYVNVNLPSEMNKLWSDMALVSLIVSIPIQFLLFLCLEKFNLVYTNYLALVLACIGTVYYVNGGLEPFKFLGVYHDNIETLYTADYKNGSYYKRFKNVESPWIRPKNRVLKLKEKKEFIYLDENHKFSSYSEEGKLIEKNKVFKPNAEKLKRVFRFN